MKYVVLRMVRSKYGNLEPEMIHENLGCEEAAKRWIDHQRVTTDLPSDAEIEPRNPFDVSVVYREEGKDYDTAAARFLLLGVEE